MEAVLINTAGGLTGGDRFLTEIEADPGCHAVITTQALEKVYRSSGGNAEVTTRLRIGAGATLAWLPQETILFEQSGLTRRLEADLDEDASLLILEAVIFGRQAMGEQVRHASFRDSWRIRQCGHLVHADETAFDGPVGSMLGRSALLGGRAVMASLVYVGPDAEDRLADAREAIGGAGGASAWDGRLTVRLVAADGLALRRTLVPLISILAGPTAMPRLWHI